MNEATYRAQGTVHYLFARDMTTLTPEEQRIALQAAQFHLTLRNSKDYNTRTELSNLEDEPIAIKEQRGLCRPSSLAWRINSSSLLVRSMH